MLPKQINPRAGFFELQNSANTGSLGSEHHLSWVHENKQKLDLPFKQNGVVNLKKRQEKFHTKEKFCKKL